MLATTTAEKGQLIQHLGRQHENKFSAKSTWTYRPAFFLPENWAQLLKKVKTDEKLEEKCVPACVHGALHGEACTLQREACTCRPAPRGDGPLRLDSWTSFYEHAGSHWSMELERKNFQPWRLWWLTPSPQIVDMWKVQLRHIWDQRRQAVVTSR